MRGRSSWKRLVVLFGLAAIGAAAVLGGLAVLDGVRRYQAEQHLLSVLKAAPDVTVVDVGAERL